MASSNTNPLPDAALRPIGGSAFGALPWGAIAQTAQRLLWGALSIGLFAGLWELCWALGWSDPKLLPPPHVFIGNIVDQAKFFNTVNRWQIGAGGGTGPSPALAVVYTVAASTGRVLTGLVIAFSLAITTGVAVRYFRLFERLTLPTITLLAPVSPIAWLPVAIFLFGIGNGPAVFMVVVALFFHMVLATITQIDGVNRNFVSVARTMGAIQAADLCPGGDPGDFAGAVHGAAAQPVRRVDGGADRRGHGRRLRVGAGDHAGAQHVQSVAGVLHHRADRGAWIHLRLPAAPGAAAVALLGAAGSSETELRKQFHRGGAEARRRRVDALRAKRIIILLRASAPPR